MMSLTAGVDSFTPGANAVINGILGTGATINSFDSVVAAGTNDTFNIADSSTTAAFGMPASLTLSGLTTVNLSRSGGAVGSIGVTNTTFGTGVTAFNLTEANTTGTAGSVVIALNSATSVSAVNTGTAWVSTGSSVTDGSTGANVLNTVTLQGFATGAAVALTGKGITTVNLNNVLGGTTVTSTGALTVNASGTGTTAPVAVGTMVAPRTDPYLQNYRIRLLLEVLTRKPLCWEGAIVLAKVSDGLKVRSKTSNQPYQFDIT